MSLRTTAVWVLAAALGVALWLLVLGDPAQRTSGPNAVEPTKPSGMEAPAEEQAATPEQTSPEESARVDASTPFYGSSDAGVARVLRTEWDVLKGPLTGKVFKSIQGAERYDVQHVPLERQPIEFLIESPALPPTVIGECTTARDGSYSFDLAPISHALASAAELADQQLLVWVRDARLLSSSQRASLSSLVAVEKHTRDWRILETDECRVRGRVLGPDGEPLVGAEVFVHSFAGRNDTRTNAAGEFVLDTGIRQLDANDERIKGVDLRSLGFAASHVDYARTSFDIDWWRVARVHDIGDVRLDRAASERATILGQVLSSDEQALAHWPLHFRPNPQTSWMRHQVLTSDAEGKFALHVEPGELVHLSLPSYGGASPQEVRAPRGGVILQSFLPTASIRCVDPQGNPITPRKTWNCYPLVEFGSESANALDRNQRVQKHIHGATFQATFPAAGTYSIRHEWPGLRGTWRIDQAFDVTEGHQELVITADYIPKGEL
jgi:hypothetical protein